MRDQHAHAVRGSERPWLAAVAVVALFAALALLLTLSGREHERSAFDQNKFHVVAIERFASQWPRFDFSDYESATTPGYHVVLATAKVAAGLSVGGLRVVASVCTMGLLGVLGWWVASRRDEGLSQDPLRPRRASATSPAEARGRVVEAVVLILPLLCSVYVFFAGVWLLPDNAAWLGVLGVLLLALRREQTVWSIAGSGLVLLGLILTRQVHVWAAGPLVVGVFLAWPRELDSPTGSLGGLLPPIGERQSAVARAVLAGVACLPAFLVLLAFAKLWSGLTPPAFQPRGSPLTNPDFTNVGGTSPATPAFILALIGIFGAFYALRLWPALRRGTWMFPAMVGACAALVISVLPQTSYSWRPPEHADMSRMSGFWNGVKAFEGFTHVTLSRSPVIILPAILGGAWLGMWWSALPRRAAWVLGVALLAFTAAHTAGALSWQRYFEPMVLMLLVLASASLPRGTKGADRTAGTQGSGAWMAGPIVLALIQTVILLSSLKTA